MTDRLPVPYSQRQVTEAPGKRRDEASLRSLICHIGRLMHQAHYIDGTSGNISARLDPDHVLVTPAGLAQGFIQPDQLIVIDVDGNKVEPGAPTNRDLHPPAELSMHLECYRNRPDVMGVVHAHPPTAVALTLANVSFQMCVVPEAIVVLGLVPTAPYSTPTSLETRDVVRALISHHDALMLAYHGSLTVGPDVWQAYLKLETLEHTATILHRAAQLGPIRPLPPEQIARLMEMRRQLGYWRPGDEEYFCECCGVC